GTNGYTSTFGGTSAASPEAAGVVALILQANPNLTWRDVKHILARTARQNDPANPGWAVNPAGPPLPPPPRLSPAPPGAARALAQGWWNAPPQAPYTSGPRPVGEPTPDNNTTGVTQSFLVPADFAVEAVEVVMNVTHAYVGDLRIVLTAPSGTTSLLAAP